LLLLLRSPVILKLQMPPSLRGLGSTLLVFPA